MKIYNLCLFFALLLIVNFSYLYTETFAAQVNIVEASFMPLFYPDKVALKKEADRYFGLFLYNYNNSDLREKYLDIAMNKYYLLTCVNPSDINAFVRLAKIYDEKKQSELSKEYFYKALNMDKNMPYANYYFGDYYYKRNDYKKALYYYKIAYNDTSIRSNFNINLKLAKIYEKLADFTNAKKFYELSYEIKYDKDIEEKIKSLNE